MLNGNLAGAGADAAAERAIIQALTLGVHAGGVLCAVAVLPWLAMVAWRTAGRLPRTVTVLLWIAAVAPLGGFVAAGLQVGLVGLMVAFGVVGGILLTRARRVERLAPGDYSTVQAASARA